MKKNYLGTTNRNVAWFQGAFERDELDMKPPFQRNPVWVNKQKSYLIDTILSGYPIPEIYMQETVDEKGNAKYIIVDGQQRTRTILEFIEGKFKIDARESPNYADLYFQDLSVDMKKIFYSYNFVIRVLPDASDEELRAIFQRLNKNVVALNKQELRQATYWGPFIKTMNEIANKEYWTKIGLFSSNDIRRMLDVEYISELAMFYLGGYQNKKDSLDNTYAFYEEEFEQEDDVREITDTICTEVLKILPNIYDTRWRKKSDFYTLFSFFSEHSAALPLSKDDRLECRERLLIFGDELDQFVKTTKNQQQIEFSPEVKEYSRGIRATTDIGSRKARQEGLKLALEGIFDAD